MKFWLPLLASLLICQLGRAAAPTSWNVRQLGAVGDGKSKDTAAFQSALDQCGKAGGGEVDVPPGTYLIGSIALPSGTTLRLEKDARLQGSPDLSDYPIVQVRWEGQWISGHRALIYASQAHDIAIVGPGSIAADAKLGGRTMPRRPVLIEPIDCTNIRLEDFSTTHARMWSIHPTRCTNITAHNLTIRSTGSNGDGIDVDSCRHVRIEDCDIDTGDDCIAIKSGRGLAAWKSGLASSDIIITGCKLGDSGFACIGIGSEDSGGVHDVRITHCIFTHARSQAIYIKSRIGRGAPITGISADDLDVTTTGFLRINLLTSGIAGSDAVPGDDGIPSGSDFSFTNVKVKCRTLVDAGRISEKKPLAGLALTNISGTSERGITLANVTGAVLKNISVTGLSRSLLETYNVTGTGLDGAVPYKPPTTRETTGD